MCECPIVQGVKFTGDGYTHCEGKCFTWDDIVDFGSTFRYIQP